MYCPNCGTKNKPNSHFCKNCGFDFAKYKQRMNQHSAHQEPVRHASQFTRRPRPQQPMQPVMPPKRKRHHFGIIALVIIALLVFGGVYTYSNNIFPFNNGPMSSESQNNPSVIKNMWQKVNNKLGSESSNGGPGNYADDFQGGTGNSAYNVINNWAKGEIKADNNNDVDVSSIKPYDFQSLGNGKYSYKVRYNYKINQDDGSSYHHIQVFNWKDVVKNGKIVSSNSPKTPSQDYHE